MKGATFQQSRLTRRMMDGGDGRATLSAGLAPLNQTHEVLTEENVHHVNFITNINFSKCVRIKLTAGITSTGTINNTQAVPASQ